jgi:N-acetylmuramoyl-L-alanine amidase
LPDLVVVGATGPEVVEEAVVVLVEAADGVALPVLVSEGGAEAAAEAPGEADALLTTALCFLHMESASVKTRGTIANRINIDAVTPLKAEPQNTSAFSRCSVARKSSGQKSFAARKTFGYRRNMPGIAAKVIGVLSLAALGGCTTTTTTRSVPDTTKTFNTVVVDAGHGGKDNGAYRRYGGAEKVATLDVASRLARDLRAENLHVVMTRSQDVFIELDDRVNMGNAQANSIFVSIHFNDSSRRAIHGFETYYHSPQSRELAERIQSKLLTLPHAASRGVKVARFRVLRNASHPSVLVECGFLSNRSEGDNARDADYRDALADKIAAAIVEVRYGRSSRTAAQ